MRPLLCKSFLLALFVSSVCASPAGSAQPKSSSTTVALNTTAPSHRFRIRTITAGVNLRNTSDLATVESAILFLQRAKKKFEDEGYEIQTLRIATQPLPEYLNGKSRVAALADLRAIDGVVSSKNVLFSIGPVITDDRYDPEFAVWATQLVRETKNINFSV